MPKPITVLVAGAAGRQGGAVARLLLEKGHRVRALVRAASSSVAEDFRALGAEVASGDLEDGSSIERAAVGADAFFLAASPFDGEPQAELRAGRAAAEAAQAAGVKHLVYSSVAGTDWTTGVPAIDGARQVELHIQELAIPFTVIAPTFFMDDLLGPMFVEGLRRGTLSLPLPRAQRLQMTCLADAATFVRMAVERPSVFLGKRLEIASDELTGPEVASALARAARSPIGFTQASLADALLERDDLARLWEWIGRVGFDVDLQALQRDHPDVGWHTLGAWAREQNFSFLDVASAEQPTV